MERRRFLRNLAIGVISTAIPTKVIADILTTTETGLIKGKEFIPPGYVTAPWAIDYSTKTISYVGSSDKGFTITELYNYLRDEWEEDKSKFPMIECT